MAERKQSEAEKKAKDVDISNIDDKPLTDFTTDDNSAEKVGVETIDNPDAVDEPDPNAPKDEEAEENKPKGIKRILSGRGNIYLWLFVVVLLIAVIILAGVNRANIPGDESKVNFEGTELDQNSVDELLASDTNVGTVDQTLTVAANAIFNGKILVKDSLDVAGTINVGGALSLPGITVAGDSAFENVEVENSLSILGSATIQESLTIEENLNVAGAVSIGSELTASSLIADNIVFNGDLRVNRHIVSIGGIPAISRGTALGAGGTISVNGTDIAGTVTINTGSSPPAGIFARIEFVNAYSSNPHVNITPVGSAAGALDYYIERDANGFSIGTASTPPSGSTFSFDYIVAE